MYSIIYNIFWKLKRIEKRRHEQGKPASKRIQFILGYIEWYYNVIVRKQFSKHPSTKYMLNQSPRDQKIIVSFTSYPKRIGGVWLVVESLLRQSMKPDKVILWVAKSQFPTMEDLPENLVALQKAGLTIRFCDDLRSHKKYYYAMQEFPDDLIILVDDDTFYSKDMVQKLMEMHGDHPEDIVCMTPAMITNVDDLPSVWRSPKCDEHVIHSYFAQPYSGQGTLYPPHCLDEQYAFDKDKIMSLCPYADDLWLKLMSMRKGTCVSSIYKYRSIPVNIYGTAEGSLYFINAAEGNQNDVQWENLLKNYEVKSCLEKFSQD